MLSPDNSIPTRILPLVRLVLLLTIACPSVADDKLAGEPPLVEGATTIVVLPDTERYSDDYPHHFRAQTRWIADAHERRAIDYVIHLGDITQHNAPAEWEIAKSSFAMLDGHVPYALAPGNHDYEGNAPIRGSSGLNVHFPLSKFEKWPSFGAVFEKDRLENSYHLTRIGTRDWIIVVLEMGPRNEVLEWAAKVFEKYPDHLGILVTHAYLFRENRRYDHRRGKERASPKSWGNDGEEIWQKLARRQKNLMIVLSGHVSTGGLGYLASEGDYGNTVHQMMVDYEKMRGGGMAYLRLLEFAPDGKTVQVRTYSPALDRQRRSELEDFSFELQLATRTEPRLVDDRPVRALRSAPTHRYSFDGEGGDRTRIRDSIGKAHGTLAAGKTGSRLDGSGMLVLEGDGHVTLPPGMLEGLEDASFEVWLTPTASDYRWNSVVRFGSRDDWLTYVFRTLTVHRAEIAVDGHNEDIQRKVPAKPGTPLHVIVTYEHDLVGGAPLLRYYRDGELHGEMRTKLELAEIDDSASVLGPFAGKLEELRVYDYALSAEEARGSFRAGVKELGLQQKTKTKTAPRTAERR